MRDIEKYGRFQIQDHDDDEPVFILAAGERCGSTLLQRYISSHPDFFIWGEQHGALSSLSLFYKESLEHSARNRFVSERYLSHGVQEFIANLCPSQAAIENAVRSAISMMFGGYGKRWGCKEIRCGVEVINMISSVFPRSQFILLVRDVRSCLSSLMRWEVDLRMCEEFVERWGKLASEFASVETNGSSKSLLLRYEDITADPEGHSKQLGTFLGADMSKSDPDVLKTRVVDHATIERIERPEPRERLTLNDHLEKLVSQPEILRVMSQFGYV